MIRKNVNQEFLTDFWPVLDRISVKTQVNDLSVCDQNFMKEKR